MDAQAHEDRRREMEAVHPIVDESEPAPASPTIAEQAEKQIEDTAAQAVALSTELNNLTRLDPSSLRRVRANAHRILDNIDTLIAWSEADEQATRDALFDEERARA